MKKSLPILIGLLFGLCSVSFANNFTSSGTGIKYNLTSLVAASGGDVLFNGTEYLIQDTITISANDTLEILDNATLKFIANSFLLVNGVLIIDPPTGVLLTAQDINTRFLGIKLDNSIGSIIKKVTMEYANSLQLFDSSPLIDSCIFRNNALNTNFGRTVINLFRSNATISNSLFDNNYRVPIAGGANIANAPRIIGCTFSNNNQANENKPQVNLGTSGTDTTFILNNTFLQASTRSGGIGFLPLGDVFTVIKGNTIVNNRYGILLQGGSNINALVSYNHIEGNNIEGNPNLGGSGISFAGGSPTSHQNTIVTGNFFKNNLWGITIQNNAQPNLGNLSNSDTADDGKNYFINNTNASVPGIDLYNNTADPIFAQGNYWYSDDPIAIENKIFHFVDNAALGLVNYSNYLLPVSLLSFDAVYNNNKVLLHWQTTAETNSSNFEIQRSLNGSDFITIGTVNASGTSLQLNNYAYADEDLHQSVTTLYYRLKIVDNDLNFKLSKVISIALSNKASNNLKVYPTLLNNTKNVQAEIIAAAAGKVIISFIDAKGAVLQQQQYNLQKGFNKINVSVSPNLPKTTLYLKFETGSEVKTIPLINN